MTAAVAGDDAAGATMEGASVTKVLDGRVAIVTGAGRGLGLEIAKGLAAEGACFGEWAESQAIGAGRR